MDKTYIYRLKSKYARNKDLLLELGFNYCKTDDDLESYYVMPIKLKKDNPITDYLTKVFEKIYSKANDEQKEEFKDYHFDYNGHLIWDEKIEQEFTECELCVSDNVDDIDKNVLFINAPDKITYYNTEIICKCIPNIINKLLEEKVIYAKRYKEKK